jgi:cell division protein FtsB
MSRLKKSGFLSKLLFLVGLLLLWSLVKGFLELKRAYKRIDEAKEVANIEQVRHEELEKKLEEVQKEEYIEKVIRDELNMQKEGETVVVLQDSFMVDSGTEQETKVPDEKKKQNWEKWLDLVR